MTAKEIITLTKEQETLLIPLYSKAQENPIFVDEKAREILERVQYNFAGLNIPMKTQVTLCIRARQMDAYTREFLGSHPNAVVIHLGCGLDSRCLRLARPGVEWYDLDLPDVIALRRKFYSESANYHLIASSVTDLAWMDCVTAAGRPVFVAAEGLLMYLQEEDVRALILALHDRFPGCGLAFDAFSRLTARQVSAHPSVQKTGASLYWGVDDPTIIEHWGEGIRFKEEWFFGNSDAVDRLGPGYRWMFKISNAFMIAKRAHRLLRFDL
jgi:O-methyltransferase involved in polyketide biosynthesis